MTSPVIVVAWDSAEPSVLQRGIEEGWMPVLRDLREGGRSYSMSGSQRDVPGAVWPNTVTGTDVSGHGSYIDKQLVAGTYRIVQRSSREHASQPFWRWIHESGLRSVIVGVYGAPILRGLNGVQAIGWGTSDPYWTDPEPGIEPPAWRRRLLREIGKRDLHLKKIPETHDEQRAFRDVSIEGVRDQARGLRLLARETDWDFFFGGFGEPHHAGHMLWHTEDPETPEHAGTPQDLRGSLSAIYRELDEGLGLILEALPADARVIVFSPHGMWPQPIRADPIEAILERGGWLARREPSRPTPRGVAKAAWRLGKRLTTRRIRNALGRFLPRDRWYLSLMNAEADWSRTSAFPLYPDHLSYLRLNVVGREPEGIVSPEEVDALSDEIANAVMGLEDADTGRQAVVEVVRLPKVLGGGEAAALPDLGIRWATTRATRRLVSPTLGTIEMPEADYRTGMHRLPGFLAAAGPGIEPDGGGRLEGPEVSAIDLAPTVFRLLGIEVPAEMHGRPIAGL